MQPLMSFIEIECYLRYLLRRLMVNPNVAATAKSKLLLGSGIVTMSKPSVDNTARSPAPYTLSSTPGAREGLRTSSVVKSK